jgi:hypothetical protein
MPPTSVSRWHIGFGLSVSVSVSQSHFQTSSLKPHGLLDHSRPKWSLGEALQNLHKVGSYLQGQGHRQRSKFSIYVYSKTSKFFSFETTWPTGFILGHNDPWTKAFIIYIRFCHIFKVKVTFQGQRFLYMYILKLQSSYLWNQWTYFVLTKLQWMKAFESCINQCHVFKVNVTGQGQISQYKHIVKLHSSSSLKP